MTSVIWNRNQIVQMICRENEHTLSRWSDAFNCMNCSVLRSTVEFAINFMWNCECNFHASRNHAQMSTTIVICCGCTRFGQRPIERLIALILSLISLLHTTVEHKLFAQCSFDGVPGTHKQRTNNKWNWRSPGSSRPPCLFWLDFWLVFIHAHPYPHPHHHHYHHFVCAPFPSFVNKRFVYFQPKFLVARRRRQQRNISFSPAVAAAEQLLPPCVPKCCCHHAFVHKQIEIVTAHHQINGIQYTTRSHAHFIQGKWPSFLNGTMIFSSLCLHKNQTAPRQASVCVLPHASKTPRIPIKCCDMEAAKKATRANCPAAALATTNEWILFGLGFARLCLLMKHAHTPTSAAAAAGAAQNQAMTLVAAPNKKWENKRKKNRSKV